MTDFRERLVGSETPVPTNLGMRRYINLDNAASTPPLATVLEAVTTFAPWYSSVHRGNGYKSRVSTEMYEAAREQVARFVGANPAEHTVLFGKNTTEAINKLSHRLHLNKMDIVLISHLEHHSNDLPWRARATVRRIGLRKDGRIDSKDFQKLLRQYQGCVRLVAISGASNVTGYIPDVHWFAKKAHEAGAQIMIDAAQLAAHRPIAMGRLDESEHLDYVAISGHKMYAPFGSGALIGRRDTFETGEPEYSGGGTVKVVTPTTIDWTSAPDRDEAGSPNIIGAIALAEAMHTLTRIDLKTIAAHETKLLKYALKRLKEVPGLVLYGEQTLSAENGDRSGVIPFTIQDIPPHLIAAVLGYEWGIGVRSGCFCAQPYVMTLLDVDEQEIRRIRHRVRTDRRDLVPGMVRISFGLGNIEEEVDLLITALFAIVRGEYGEYTLDKRTGAYAPVREIKTSLPNEHFFDKTERVK